MEKTTSIGEFPKCTEDALHSRVALVNAGCKRPSMMKKEWSPGAFLFVTFLGHARKVTKNEVKKLKYSLVMDKGQIKVYLTHSRDLGIVSQDALTGALQCFSNSIL